MEENNNIVQSETIINEPEPNNINNENKGGGSKKVLTAIIVILVLIIAGLLVYMFVIKGDDKEKNTNNNNNNNSSQTNNNTNNNNDNNNTNNNQTNNGTDTTSVTDEDIDSIISLMHKYYLFNLIYDESNNTFSKTNITNGQLLGFESYYYELNGNSYADSIAKTEADNYFTKVYGFNADTYKDIICLVDKDPLYKYETTELKWNKSENEHGHGGWDNDFADYYIVNKSINGNEISLDFIFLYYGEFTFDTFINGKTVDMGNEIDYDHYAGDEQLHDEMVSKQKEYFKKHINEYTSGKIYNYVFEKDGNNYYLKSFKVK